MHLQTTIFAEQTLHPATHERNLSPKKPITVWASFPLWNPKTITP